MQKQSAFTLIELLITMMVGGIVAVISVQFIAGSGQALIDTGARQQLAATAAVINEQISRQLRQALPGSIRTTSDGACIEFMPVLAATVYRGLDTGQVVSSLTAIPVSASDNYSGYLSVYPIHGNLYNPDTTGPLTTATATLPAGSALVTVNLPQPHRFPSASPEQRLYISAAPQTFCQDGTWLYRYRGYGFINAVSQLPAALPADYAAGREVMAAGLSLGSLQFDYSPPTLKRNGLVSFSFILTAANGDQLTSAQEVQIHNVP